MAEYNAEFCSNSGTDSAEIPLPWWLPLAWEPSNAVILTHWSAASWETAAFVTPVTRPRLLSWLQGWVCTNCVVWGSWSRQSRSREADGQSRQTQVGAKLKGGLIQFTAPRIKRPAAHDSPHFPKFPADASRLPAPFPGWVWFYQLCVSLTGAKSFHKSPGLPGKEGGWQCWEETTFPRPNYFDI